MAGTEKTSPPPRVVGYDAWDGQSWCPPCAFQRFQMRNTLEPKDPNGEVITSITTTDEFVDEMTCSNCRRPLTGDWHKRGSR